MWSRGGRLAGARLAPPALAALILVLLLPRPGGAEEIRTGWHGEAMPPGLERAEAEGDYRWSRDGSVMVYVPAGPFSMGIDDGDDGERPVHKVWLDAYYIDKYEVSWGQWKRSGLPFSESPSSRLLQPRAPDWGIRDGDPVVNVSWEDAQAYVSWAGKILPSEAQWEKAARSDDGRTFPWGEREPTIAHAMWVDHPMALESAAPVTCCAAGASPYGAHNLAGNVWEWCRDVYDPDFYQRSPPRNPVFEGAGKYRVLRGGAFLMGVQELRSGVRYRLLPMDRTPYIGFRAALAATEPHS